MLSRVLVFIAVVIPLAAATGDVELLLNTGPATPGDYKPGDVTELTLRNGIVSITFGPDGSATSLILIRNGQELAHNLNGIIPRDVDAHRTWYIDYNAGAGHLVADNIRIISVSPEMAHIAIIDSGETSAFYLEHHILLMKGDSGFYGYVICRNPKNRRLGGEMRSMYRLDRNIFDWAYVSERTGHQPTYSELVQYPSVQDETWKLPDGGIYQKYDYSGYLAENPVWGHYGHGFGVWFIPASTEYYAGGPLRQDLLVHQDALILNYFQGAHYGGGGADNFTNGEKLFGPWFTYINTGENAQMIADAKQRALAEQARWPYQWMREPLYPLIRANVTGRLSVEGRGTAAGAMVVLPRKYVVSIGSMGTACRSSSLSPLGTSGSSMKP